MFKKILVAIDGSEASLHALDVAASQAKQNGAELTILTVVPPVPALVEGDMPEHTPDFEDQLYESYKKMLAARSKEIKEKYPSLKVAPIAMRGRPAKMIIDAAAAREVDLIVVGNRGKSGIFSWMLGSVSRTVTDACTVPVLVVKNQKFCEA